MTKSEYGDIPHSDTYPIDTDFKRRHGKERDLEGLIDVNSTIPHDEKTVQEPDEAQKVTLSDQLLYAKAKLQFPDMSEEDLQIAVQAYKEIEGEARDDFFKEYAKFEEVMSKPKQPKLNRAQRRARAKAARKPVHFHSSDKPVGRPKGYQPNDVPVSHASPKHEEEARQHTLRAQRERLINMYEDLDDPNYIAPVLPEEALQQLDEANTEVKK